jgi:hypothetical protein
MSVINQSKNVTFIAPEDLPRDPTIPVNKSWKWKEGCIPAAGEDGLIAYPVIDSCILGGDGKPVQKIKHIPEELADVVNGIPGLRSPYPTPSDPLAADEEFVVAGPGMWGVQKKSARVVDPILVVLDRIEAKIDSIISNI